MIYSKNKDAIIEMNQSLRNHAKFAKMVDYSAEVLVKMCVDDVAREELIDLGTVETCFDVLAINQGDQDRCEKIQHSVNQILRSLATDEERAKMVYDKMDRKKDPAMFVNSLQKHTDPKTVESTCEAILALTQDERAIEDLAAAGAIEALAQVIKDNPDKPEVVTAATRVLARFSDKPDNAKKIMDTGVIDAVTKAMEEHNDNEPLVEAATTLIANLASVSDENGIDKLKALGCVDKLIQALDDFPYNEVILENAAIALKYLTGANDMEIALSYFKDKNVPIDDKTAKALGKVAGLLLVEENAQYMYDNFGDIGWVLDLMKRAKEKNTPAAKKILAHGARAVQRAMIDEDKVYNLLQLGGVAVLQDVMQKHARNDEIASSTANAFGALLTRKENAKYLADSGVAKDALNILENTPLEKERGKAALALVQGLAGFRDAAKVLNDERAIPILVKKLDEDPTPEMMKHVVNTLGRTAIDDKALKQLKDQRIIPKCLDILKQNPDDADLVKETLMLMETACMDEGNVKDLQADGKKNKELLRDLGVTHANDKEINDLADRLKDIIDDKLKREAEALKKAEQERLKELERLRKKEEARLAELERARKLEEERMNDELEELERLRLAELERLRAQDLQRQKDEEAARQAELERMKLEQEGKLAELEALRKAREKAAEEERQRRLQEEKDRQAEEERFERLRLARLEKEKERLRQEELERLAREEAERAAELERLRLEREERERREGERLRLEKEEAERLALERAEMERLKLEREAERARLLDEKKKKMADARRRMQMEMQEQENLMRERALQKKKERDEGLDKAKQLRLDRDKKKQEELEMAEQLRLMKQKEEAEQRRKDREARARELEEARRQAKLNKSKKLASDKHKKNFRTVKLTKSARDIFDDNEEEKEKKKAELPQWVKDFLLAGALLTKHGEQTFHQRHVYLSPDLEYLCWKNPKKELKNSQRMKIYDLLSVEQGRATPHLQRKRMGKYVVRDEDCAMAIFGSVSAKTKHNRADDEKKSRTVDLECSSAEECEQWIQCIDILIEYAKEMSLWGSNTMVFVANELLEESDSE